MSTSTSRLTSALTSLIETCADDQEGFLTAAENVKNAELKLLFSEIAMQRLQFAKELRGLAQGFGGTIETGGTLAGAFHRAWMQLKAAVTGGDELAILTACERSEESTLARYREMLDRPDLPADIQNVIRQQFVSIRPVQKCVRELRAVFKT
jgi:uncharacterized protein (TIGR02284 family)